MIDGPSPGIDLWEGASGVVSKEIWTQMQEKRMLDHKKVKYFTRT